MFFPNHTQVDIMRSWSLALTLIAVLLLAVVLLFIVRPPVYAVQKNKEGSIMLQSAPRRLLQSSEAIPTEFETQSSK